MQTSIPQVGFEPTIPVFEGPKTIHALDRAATVIGNLRHCLCEFHKHNTRLEGFNSNRVFIKDKGSMQATARLHSAWPAHQLAASRILFS
jgi:hypothetical protein